MNIKEIALKIADSLRNKVDGISHMQSNQGLACFAEALISAYKAELLKEVGEPVLYAEFAEDGGWLGDASEYADHLEEPHALFTSDQVAAAVLKATKTLEEEIEQLKDEQFKRLEREAEKRMKLREQLAKTEQRVAEYNELIYAVQTKTPDETRHQTALRYIRNAENRPSNATANGASS